MSPETANRLWKFSRENGSGLKGWLRRLRYMVLAYRYEANIRPILEAAPGTLLHTIASQRPAVFEFTRAPYLLASWSPATRFREFVRHAEAADAIGPLMNFAPDLSVELMAIEEIGPGYHIVLDKPEWMFREGTVTFNLFKENLRLFSLTFALAQEEDGLTAIVGGLQGRSLPGMLDRYKEMTKSAHGIRPRDLIVELFRLFCAAIGVRRIYAVSNSARIHHGEIFKAKHYASLDYDEAWRDRSGVPVNAAIVDLPLRREVRAEADIPPKKRTMYHRRYEMLDILEKRMTQACASPHIVQRPSAE